MDGESSFGDLSHFHCQSRHAASASASSFISTPLKSIFTKRPYVVNGDKFSTFSFDRFAVFFSLCDFFCRILDDIYSFLMHSCIVNEWQLYRSVRALLKIDKKPTSGKQYDGRDKYTIQLHFTLMWMMTMQIRKNNT